MRTMIDQYILKNKIYATLLMLVYGQYCNMESENQFMVFSDSILQDCPYTSISKVAYILFFKVYWSIIVRMFQVQLIN